MISVRDTQAYLAFTLSIWSLQNKNKTSELKFPKFTLSHQQNVLRDGLKKCLQTNESLKAQMLNI